MVRDKEMWVGPWQHLLHFQCSIPSPELSILPHTQHIQLPKTSSVLKAKYIMIQVWIPTSTPGLKTSQELLSELIQQQLHLLY